MHPADIKAALEKAGLTQTALAGHLEVSPEAVWQVIHKHARSRRIEHAIALAICLPEQEIWPEHYKKGRARHD